MGRGCLLSRPRSRPRPGPWAVSSLCRDCLSVRSEPGGDGRLCRGSVRAKTRARDWQAPEKRGVGPVLRTSGSRGTAGGGGRRWCRDRVRVGVDARVLGTCRQLRHPGSESPRGRVFPLTRLGAECGAEGWGLGGRRGVARVELEGEPGPTGPTLRRAGLQPRNPLAPLPPDFPFSLRPLHSPPSHLPDTPSGPTAPSPAGFPDLYFPLSPLLG